jgi:DNA-binding response OmpR family regulator
MENSSIRVLILDGALQREDHVADTVTAAGFATRMVSDSVSAIGSLDIWQPSVVVVDLRSPSNESRQFCTMLAARPETEQPPVVLMAEGPNLLKHAAVNPSGLVATPVDPDQLVATVLRVARQAVSEREGTVTSR